MPTPWEPAGDGVAPQASVVLRWSRPDRLAGPCADAPPPRFLDAAETVRWRGFVRRADRDAFLAAHALRRHVLALVTGRPPEIWRFETGAFGCPVIVPPSGEPVPHASLSHCDGLAVAVATRIGPVGVDVEPRHRPVPPEVVRAVMTPREQGRIGRSGGAEAIRLWTRKEAFAKAIGLGLHLEFRDCEIDAVDRLPRPPLPDPKAAWHVAEYALGPDHVAALVVAGAPGRPPVVDVAEWSGD